MSFCQKVLGLTKQKPILLVSVSLLPAFYCCFFWVSSFSFVQKFWHKCFLCFYFFSRKRFSTTLFSYCFKCGFLRFFCCYFSAAFFFLQIFLGTLSYFNLKIYFPGEKNPASGEVLRVYYRFCKNENR